MVAGVKYWPRSRMYGGVKSETLVLPLSWGAMWDANEAPLATGTYPKIPAYDTAENLSFVCETQSGNGTTTNIWWAIIVLPETYVDATNLILKIDGKYTTTGTAACTIDLEAFPYDSTNGDFSNTDICATTVQSLTTSFATESFTLTGTTLTAKDTILLRLTSEVVESGGGDVYNSFNFPRVEFTGKE